MKYIKVSLSIINKQMSQQSLDEVSELSKDASEDMSHDMSEEMSEDMKGGGDYSDSEYEEEEDEEATSKENKTNQIDENEDDDDDEDEPDENYLMKFDREMRKNYLVDFHPETLINNYSEIQALVNITRDSNGNIIDEFHKTIPFLTKYEKTRVLGQRAKQINSGSKPFLEKSRLTHEGKPIIDGYLIALEELKYKKLPFIIRRPIPNGASEYWKLDDLDNIY